MKRQSSHIFRFFTVWTYLGFLLVLGFTNQCKSEEKADQTSFNLLLVSSYQNAQRPRISYGNQDNATLVFSLNQAVEVKPTISNFSPTQFSVSPSLPTGLVLAPTTGIITGQATQTILSKTNYTVTASQETSRASTILQVLSGPSGVFQCSYVGQAGGCTSDSIGFTCKNSPACYATVQACVSSAFCN
ncbi:Ig domain-containing protein [Leptospira ryugenii]|uniref:Ig domain-containing protein n=1 Tax=Leptospira ryugenii TaxID=1917863 RepID=UPI000D599B3B|nr:Ig domain-containing protein [Leptospira ryugenii]